MKKTVLSAVVIFAAVVQGAERPNILFLFADDQRPDTIGAYGNPHIKTPNLDRLAESGVSFRRNFCAGSFSGAVCVASRAMLMTGRYWMNIEDRKSWGGLPTFPERLAKSGYTTFIVGKWHNGKRTLARSFQSGKSVFVGGMADHTKVPLHDLTAEGELVNQRVGKEFSSTEFANAAIDFIKDYKEENPFLMYVAFTAPHDPRNPPEEYREMYYKKRPPLPRNIMQQHPFDNGFIGGGGRDESLLDWPRDPKMVSDQLCEYYGLITQLDEQVGRIVKQLEDSALLDNTIIIYTADHGLALGSHGLLGKQNIYDHSMGSPLIISGPQIPRNKDVHAMTLLTDLYPTICNFAGVPVEGVDGKNLAPLWSGETKQLHANIFLPFQNIMRAVSDGRWKLHIYPQINHKLLFDLKNDPDEMSDVAENYPQHVERLTKLMVERQRELGDKQPLTVENPNPKFVDLTGSRRVLDVWQPKWIRDKYYGGRSETDHGAKRVKKR